MRYNLPNGNYLDIPLNCAIVGSGGGAKAPEKAYVPQSAPVTLQSNAVASFILAYSAGETGGLINGAKSIYFDETPLQNEDGSYNFEGVKWEERFGLPDQSYVPGHEQSANTRDISTQLFEYAETVRSVSSGDVDAARLIISLPRLLNVTAKGDQLGTSVSINFHVKDRGVGIWQDRGTKTITGRTDEQYQIAFRIEKPTTVTGIWDIAVTRTTPDATVSTLSNDTYWSTMVELLDGHETYANVAYIAVQIDTALFGNKVPKLALRVDGVKVKVPVNYNQTNPMAPVYTGIWDGSFKWEATNNPMWHLYNFLINTKYGLAMEEQFINRYSFYSMAQYCDAVDPLTGNFVGVNDEVIGSKRPRFTLRTQLLKQEDALAMLNTIMSSARGMTFWGASTMNATQDCPKSISYAVNNEDVEGGVFSYSTSREKDRVNVASVQYNDTGHFWKPGIVVYPPTNEQASNPAIQRLGRIETKVWKYGCASRAEATSYAKWIVVTSQKETKLLTFSGGPRFAMMRPGDVIEIYDKNISGVRFGGRIASATLSSVTADAPVELRSGITYILKLVANDGLSVIERTLTNAPGAHVVLTFATQLPDLPNEFTVWSMSGPGDVVPQPFRVMAVKKDGNIKYAVSCLQYDKNKFAEVEDGLVFPDEPYFRPNTSVVLPVSNIAFDVRHEINAMSGVSKNILLCTWTKSPSELVMGYNIIYRYEDGTHRDLGNVLISQIEIDNIKPGKHYVSVYAFNIAGVYSISTSAQFDWQLEGHNTLHPALNLHVKDGTTTFSGKDLTFVWEGNPLNDNAAGVIFQDYQVEIWTADGVTLIRQDWTKNLSYMYTHIQNRADGGLRRSLLVKIYCRDATNQTDAIGAERVFTNPAPPAPNFIVTAGFNQAFVVFTPSTDEDVAGYVVCMGTSSGFSPDATNLQYNGPDTIATFAIGTAATYYFKVGAYDIFDNTVANIIFSSAASAVIADALLFTNVWTEGFNFTPNSPDADKISWTAGVVHYELSGTTSAYNIEAGDATWTEGSLYVYWDLDLAPTTLIATTNIINTAGRDKRVLCVYGGGANIFSTAPDAPVDGAKIIDATIVTNKIVDEAITAGKIGAFAVDASKIVDGAITNAKIGEFAVDAGKIADVCIDTAKIVDGAITSGKIGSFAVDASKIVDEAITNAKIGNFAVDANKIANSCINTSKIVDDAITAAQLAPGSVQTEQIALGAVVTASIANNAINAQKIQDNSLTTVKLVDDAITSTKIAAGAVQAIQMADGVVINSKLANFAVDAAKIANLAVGAAQIANAAITNAKIGVAAIASANIQDAAITNAKIGALAVASANIQDASIVSAKIQDAAIVSAKINDAAITSAKILDAAITNAKIGALAVDAAKIVDAAITNAKIQDAAITNAKIGALAVSAASIQDAAITNAKIANLAVDAAKIQALAVGAAQIQDAAITNAKIGALAVDAAKIAALAVGSAHIQDAAITNAKIGALAVSVACIQDAAITNAKIANLAVDTAKIANLAIDTTKITDAAITNAKIQNLSVDAAKIANLAITNAKIANASIATANIIDGAIVSAKIANAQIGNAHITQLAGDKIIAGTISSAQLVTGVAVITQTAQISNAIITGAQIQAAQIGTAHIQDASITNAKIGYAAIGTAHIGDLTVDTIKIRDGAITQISAVYVGGGVSVGTGWTTVATITVASWAVTTPKWLFNWEMKVNGSMGEQYTSGGLGVCIYCDDSMIWGNDGVGIPIGNYNLSVPEQGQASLAVYYYGVARGTGMWSGSGPGLHTWSLRAHTWVYGRTISEINFWMTEIKR
jgi:uncharacterized protein YjbI with pentapeptide repeats